MEKRKALCVGINNFKNFPDAALKGCVNDAKDMSAVLIKYFGFAKKDITVLTDRNATKKNILQRLKEMVQGARKGSYNYLIFSLSSHGTQIPDVSGDEADQADEAFCPHDLAQKKDRWDPNYIITDDELHDLFMQIPENVLLEVYLDTCHSGTGLKAIDLLLTRQPRYLPPPSLKAFKQVQFSKIRTLRSKLLDTDQPNHILWAACRDNQTSADALIDGDWHGAFTYYLCRELQASQGNIVRRDLVVRIKDQLAENEYTQVPQLEYKATLRKK
jgi:metacaspase-1